MFELQALTKCLQISPGFGSKIRDTCFLGWRRKMWNKNVQHTLKFWGLCFVPLPLLILISSFIQCICVILFKQCKERFYLFIIPVIHYAYYYLPTHKRWLYQCTCTSCTSTLKNKSSNHCCFQPTPTPSVIRGRAWVGDWSRDALQGGFKASGTAIRRGYIPTSSFEVCQ